MAKTGVCVLLKFIEKWGIFLWPLPWLSLNDTYERVGWSAEARHLLMMSEILLGA